MRTREDLKKELLYNLENRVRIWSENTAGCSEQVVRSELENCNHVMQNIDEATSIVAAEEAAHLLYLYASDNMHIAYNSKGIEQGDQVDYLLNNINVPKSTLLGIRNTDLWDENVQKIYEAMGCTTVLPRHSEINALEYEIEKLKATGADRNAIIDLEEQLNLKKCALGELTSQWSAGIPYRLSEDVKRTSQMEREMHQVAVESSLNTVASVRR